jgi:predicted N-acetyltransferase YhbS
MSDFELRRFQHGGAEYEQALALRNKVLRKPLGLDLYAEDLSGETRDIHLGAFIGGKLVGNLTLTPRDPGVLQMRQVAVHPDHQRKGIGGGLVRIAEKTAREEGCREIILHARETAKDFYLALGYEAVGERFVEIGIPHWNMVKKLL